jgi:hypothetical protein
MHSGDTLHDPAVTLSNSCSLHMLITRIMQDSTVMWEQAAPGIMDAAVGEHHALIRRLAIQHAGYESATEVGPILSFPMQLINKLLLMWTSGSWQLIPRLLHAPCHAQQQYCAWRLVHRSTTNGP